MTAGFPLKAPHTGYIGVGVPRPGARRLLQGRGRYVDDIHLPRMVHAAFVRSPYAHARIVKIDVSEAAVSPGVIRVVSGAEVASLGRRPVVVPGFENKAARRARNRDACRSTPVLRGENRPDAAVPRRAAKPARR